MRSKESLLQKTTGARKSEGPLLSKLLFLCESVFVIFFLVTIS